MNSVVVGQEWCGVWLCMEQWSAVNSAAVGWEGDRAQLAESKGVDAVVASAREVTQPARRVRGRAIQRSCGLCDQVGR